jgi:predicted HAD superfamily phosphohydrolase
MMKKITLSIPDDLDELFRRYIETEYRGIKGAISIVGIKAIEKYLEQVGHNSIE